MNFIRMFRLGYLSNRLFVILIDEQVDGKAIVSRRTMYPGGEAVTLDLEFRPLRMICDDEQGPVTVVLVTAIPVAVQVYY